MRRKVTRAVLFSSVALFRDGIASMLQESGAVLVVATASDWPELLRLVADERPEAVVISRDEPMPASFMDDIFARSDCIRVVLVTPRDDGLAVHTHLSVAHPRRGQLVDAVVGAGTGHATEARSTGAHGTR